MRRVGLLGLFLSVFAICLGPQAWGETHSASPSVRSTGAAAAVGTTLAPIDQATLAAPPEAGVGATLRLIPLPDGVGGATVRALAADGTTLPARTLPAMVARGIRLLPVVIDAGEPAGAFRLEYAYDKAVPAPPVNEAARRCGRGFLDALRPFLADDSAITSLLDKSGADQTEGTYLVITAPEYRDAVEPLLQWKREKGLQVRVATTDETGTDRTQIRAWIGNLYRNDPRPPQFVVLVGDVADVAAYDFHGVVSDLPYALQEGDDFLPDLEIGRLSVSGVSQAQTVVAKILRNERDPYRGNGPTGADWMGRGLVVGADLASSTPRPVSRWIRSRLLQDGFSRVDSVYYPPIDANGPQFIAPRVNAGVSLVTYRGWAAGFEGWQSPKFINTNVHGLTNGWMLPVVCSFVCLNNKFDEAECFGEAWLRAGSPEQPQGAVAFIGNSEHWSHTRFNDAMAIGAITGVHQEGIRRVSAMLDYAKLNLLRQFPLEIPYASEGGESVEFYFHIYNLLGDPEMELWMGPPRAITVSHPDTLDLGANLFTVQVATSPDAAPVGGLRVALSQGDQVLGCVWTDSDGQARVPVAGLIAGAPVKVTVTGGNCQPYQATIVTANRPARPGLAGVTVLENGSGGTIGNADGRANPGETVAFLVTLRNPGTSALTGVTADLQAEGADSVETVSVSFPSIAAGGTADAAQPFLVRLRREAEDGTPAPFTLRVDAGGIVSLLEATVALAAPSLRFAACPIDAAFVPGGETNLTVTVRNEGTVSAGSVRGILHSLNPELLTPVDSIAEFGTIAAGASASALTPFRVRASSRAAMGAVANLQLVLDTDEGYTNRTGFAVSLGTADLHAPLGGSAYGYWAYDNSDTDYPDGAPLYQWTEISSAYGGPGTKVPLNPDPAADVDANPSAVVTLPFSFRFYGQDYGSLKISDNGWVSFDLATDYDFYNWSMPTAYGDGAKIAAFWDNLHTNKKDTHGNLVGDGVYTWADAVGHRFYIEWSRIGNTDQSVTPPEVPHPFTDLQTFQIVLHDPASFTTPTGDGMIEFRYKQVLNVDVGRMYSTVGIMDEDGKDGIEYSYSNRYPPQAAPLSPGLAIRWTTQPPRYVPFSFTSFRALRAPGGVALSWQPVDERPRGGYRIERAGADGVFLPVALPAGAADGAAAALDGAARGFLDTTADPAQPWAYRVHSFDPLGRETVLGPFSYDASLSSPTGLFALRTVGANPFRGKIGLSWTLPAAGGAELQIHGVDGRVVRTLLRGWTAAGTGTSVWNGRDDAGRPVPAGVYWARIESNGERKNARLLLVR